MKSGKEQVVTTAPARNASGQRDTALYTEAAQVFSQYMASNRCRATVERYAVLRAVMDTDGPFTVSSLHAKVLADSRLTMSIQTVYYAVALLEKAHLAKRILNWPGTDHRQAHYYKCLPSENASHFICTKCGASFDFNVDAEPAYQKRLAKVGCAVGSYSVFVYGHCAKCHRAELRKARDSKKQEQNNHNIN